MLKLSIDKTYFPFTAEELRPHFIADIDGHIAYFQKSASRYHDFMDAHLEVAGIPLQDAKLPRQIEKDERFWTITATKSIYDHKSRPDMLLQLLCKAFGVAPPIPGLQSWEECLKATLGFILRPAFHLLKFMSNGCDRT